MEAPPPPPPPLRTKWTRRVPHPVLIGHAASLLGGGQDGQVDGRGRRQEGRGGPVSEPPRACATGAAALARLRPRQRAPLPRLAMKVSYGRNPTSSPCMHKPVPRASGSSPPCRRPRPCTAHVPILLPLRSMRGSNPALRPRPRSRARAPPLPASPAAPERAEPRVEPRAPRPLAGDPGTASATTAAYGNTDSARTCDGPYVYKSNQIKYHMRVSPRASRAGGAQAARGRRARRRTARA